MIPSKRYTWCVMNLRYSKWGSYSVELAWYCRLYSCFCSRACLITFSTSQLVSRLSLEIHLCIIFAASVSFYSHRILLFKQIYRNEYRETRPFFYFHCYRWSLYLKSLIKVEIFLFKEKFCSSYSALFRD